MKAIILKDFGSPSQLVLENIDLPELPANHVLVEIQASGICHHDILHRQGRLPHAKKGVVLGHEASGIIKKIGSNVSQRQVGDRVVIYQRRFCGECSFCLAGRQDLCKSLGSPAVDTEGAYAQFISIPAISTVILPEKISFEEAALASCPIATSVRAIHLSTLKAGDTVLINGASGGLGSHQILLAKARGAIVIAVTRDKNKSEFLSKLGADHVVVSPDNQYASEIWKITNKLGVHVALDNTGISLSETLRSMGMGGHVILLGNIKPEDIQISPGLLIGRRLTLQGSGSATISEIKQSLALIEQGIIKPIIYSIMKFNDVSKAHQLLESSDISGRIILKGWK
ncbi:MAG: alcohol dehydrogenase catalytic domain-containing protein [Acinetobacter sp.]